MNRTIKFRARRVAGDYAGRGGEWVYGEFAHDDIGNAFIHWRDNESGWRHASVDEKTLGQFTGLTGKNGKEIYEGDLVTDEWRKKWGKPPETVEFKTVNISNCCCSKWDVTAWYVGETPLDTGCEVIGNIYENPELIK